ncbi:benzoylformate decarboxylase, partial [Mycobacterium kansasii]
MLVVVGAAVFDFDMGGMGPVLPEDSDLLLFTDDPEEAARAPAGDAVLGNVKLALTTLAQAVPETT